MAFLTSEKALSSSSSSSSTPRWSYDVFLSFRGEDTRNSFVEHLYVALIQKGIYTFRDDEKLESGKSISLELLKAIEESRFAIVIFSRDYASSMRCLEELVKVVGCMKEKGMTVLPVFYHVDPSDVRKQRGAFAQAFVEYEERFKENIEKVQTWRNALREVANLSGWHLQDRFETRFIQEIVKVILNKLSYTFPKTKRLVGINSRVEKLKSHLAIGLRDIRIIGIWGPGGMGKTTLARVVYDMVYNQFEAFSFVADVREVSEKNGLHQLQEKILNELWIDRDGNIHDNDIEVLSIMNSLRHKKILLVLDDINELDQLKQLVGRHDWFGLGSRVIITTRDVDLLFSHQVNEIYEVEALNDDEALELFSLKAFKKDQLAGDYVKLSQAFVHYSEGLPLALEVLGSFLFNRSIEEWKSNLDKLKKFPGRRILDVLQISFDGLKVIEEESSEKLSDWQESSESDNSESVIDEEFSGLVESPFAEEGRPEQITLLSLIAVEAVDIAPPFDVELDDVPPLFDVKPVDMTIDSGGEIEIDAAIEQRGSEADQHKEARLLLMQGGLGSTKPPEDVDWENAKEIYLMNNELSVLPENLMCPELSVLFLQRNYKLRTIPPSFFDHMPALQVLNLSRTGIKSLPDSIIRLVNLKRLFLNDCHCFMMLSPKVGELKQLEVLDLKGTEIMHLPWQIRNLTNLTCLKVSFYECMSNGRGTMQSNEVVPRRVISAMSQLKELNIDVDPDDERWDVCVQVILTEVCNLTRLNTLKFYFPRVELLRHLQWNSPMGGIYPSLSHFRFTVGHHVKRITSRVPRDVEFELEQWERCLIYINGVGVPGDIKKVLQQATTFFLDRNATVKKLSDFGIGNMRQLKCCVVGECNEVQVIIDEADAYEEDDDSNEIAAESLGTEKIVLGSLEYLYVYRMKGLRSIWEGSVQKNSLYLLKSLTLDTCPQLTTIFTQGLLANLCNLEELKVENCRSIRGLVSCEISAEHKTSYFLPNLKKISLHFMPGLVSISGGLHIAPKVEWLSFYNCPKLKNPFIEEVSSQDLKEIKGDMSWWKKLEWSNGGPGYLDKIFCSN